MCHYWTAAQNRETGMNFRLEDLKLNPISANLIQQIWARTCEVTGLLPGPRQAVLGESCACP